MVTFRLTSEEHEAMTKCCVETGARSLADFSRSAVLQRIQSLRTPASTIAGDLMTLSKGLRQLDSSLGLLRKQIRGLLGPVTSRLNGKTEPTSGSSRED